MSHLYLTLNPMFWKHLGHFFKIKINDVIEIIPYLDNVQVGFGNGRNTVDDLTYLKFKIPALLLCKQYSRSVSFDIQCGFDSIDRHIIKEIMDWYHLAHYLKFLLKIIFVNVL